MPPRCTWSGQRSPRAVRVTLDVPSRTGGPGSSQEVWVLPEHEAELRAYNRRAARWGRPMLVAVLGLTVALVALAVVGAALGLSEAETAGGAGALVVALGLVVVAFPFATPQTAETLGVRASVLVARAAGVVTVAVGVWLAVAA